MKEYVILVDKNDECIGEEEKIKAHEFGLLHRAFSIFVFNSSGRLLIQKRHPRKYHCGSLWSNTCCSHPRPKESLEKAVHRRIKEEMGFDCHLVYCSKFIYKAVFPNGLMENEVDHVFYGIFDGEPKKNHLEIEEVKWIELATLEKDLQSSPGKYTPWLSSALRMITDGKIPWQRR